MVRYGDAVWLIPSALLLTHRRLMWLRIFSLSKHLQQGSLKVTKTQQVSVNSKEENMMLMNASILHREDLFFIQIFD